MVKKREKRPIMALCVSEDDTKLPKLNNEVLLEAENEDSSRQNKLKSRLRWTPRLHSCFVDAVNQLGGAHKATPKSLLNIMGIEGITLYHLKSHLQKYRLGKYLVKDWSNVSDESGRSKPQEIATSLSFTLSHDQDEGSELNNQGQETRKEIRAQGHMRNKVDKRLEMCRDAERKYLNAAFESACKLLAQQYLRSSIGVNEDAPSFETTPPISPFSDDPLDHHRPRKGVVKSFENVASLDEDPAETYLVLDENGTEPDSDSTN